MTPAFGRALVTGGAGFVGSHLCERLLAAGTEVVAADNFATADAGNVEHLLGLPGFRLATRDVTEPLDEPDHFDVVFHLASAASPRDYFRLPLETLRAGSYGTEHALDIAERDGARFVLASTSEVYGDPREHPQREDYWGHVNPIGPRSVYDEAKRYAEALTSAMRRERGVNTAIARIFNTYGPRMRADDGRMIPTFVCQALGGEPLTVAGTGQQTRSICYVDDTVRGLLALAASDLPGPVNLGNPHELTVLRIAKEVLSVTGSSSAIEYIDAAVDDPTRRCPDISLARRELGWEPEIEMAEGLPRTVDWYARNIPLEPLR
ncbi:NAD-dependent epimerase/dehydratase family protein [Amycolatopsis regifaucium]|uniref:Epimerase n=1 Tax=Amycolatopsis regifaucium TaxID=546365 RepID=A0A154M639_9PSEU|nr:NAD-dependent epimerase/dehydratase family protein [Amycolatopsis regifaucium]KZB79329.1 epimerase [Amycolatopsis regifaucium]OKA07512.1 epimerase [Amycolatopsis regifaucium]SFH09627.1 dTDP-glucose 4,6-dehydratase [Amycolatopsis regifaucium]